MSSATSELFLVPDDLRQPERLSSKLLLVIDDLHQPGRMVSLLFLVKSATRKGTPLQHGLPALPRNGTTYPNPNVFLALACTRNTSRASFAKSQC